MFNKFRKKLKSWVNKISEEESSKKITEEIKEKISQKEKTKKPREKIQKKFEEISGKELDEKLKKKISEKKFIEPEMEFNVGIKKFEPDAKKTIKKLKEISKDKKFFLKKVFSGKKAISEGEFDNYSEDLETILLENNVAFEISERIIKKLKEKIVGKELEKKEIENFIKKSLKEIIEEILIPPFDIFKEIKEKENPYVLLFCGINGTGKTTTIAKISYLLKKKNISSVLAAGDTFRAASIEQLKKHGENLNVKVIAHQYGSDSASVGFDAIKYAKKNGIKVVLIDTAGRIHTAKNLLREMGKIKRVCNPDRTIFVGESITGNDAVDQVNSFNDLIGIDGIILSKADIDEKGGTALSVGYVTKKPILFLGTGQEYENIELFDKKKFIEKLGLN